MPPRQGRAASAQLLIENGADVLTSDAPIQPLHSAASCWQIETAQLPTDNGADASAAGTGFLAPLYIPVPCERTEDAKPPTDNGADISPAADSSCISHTSTQLGHMEVSRLLIDNGADISAADPTATTPLHYAALFGCVEVARLLIDCGADTAAVDDVGLTPLGYAIWMGHVEVVRFLISRAAVHESGHTLLQTAFYGGHDAVLNYLLEMSARESQGSTALIEAGLQEDAAGLLFTGLINPNVDNQNVPTALGLAVSSGKLSLVQLLTNAGADPNL